MSRDGFTTITASVLVTVTFDVPSHWVAVGEMANETGITEDAVGEIQDGAEPVAAELQSWSFSV